MIACAASYYSTPVAVISGLYKLSPNYPIDQDSFNLFISPENVSPFKEGLDAHIINPYFDYVEPKYVNLFITNNGGHPPSYIYRLLEEFYDQSDGNIFK